MNQLFGIRFLSIALAGSLGALVFGCSDGSEPGEEMSRVDEILSLTGDPAAGANVFMGTCGLSTCHGADGDSGRGADLSTLMRTDAAIVNTAINGFEDMPGLGEQLSDQQYADVLAYINANL